MAETAEKPRDFISVSVKTLNLFLKSLTASIYMYLRVATEHINLHLQTLLRAKSLSTKEIKSRHVLDFERVQISEGMARHKAKRQNTLLNNFAIITCKMFTHKFYIL